MTDLRFKRGAPSDLGHQLRDAAQAHLQTTHDHRYANPALWVKGLLLAASTGLCYWSALSTHSPLAFMGWFTLSLFLAMACAMNILHDGAHLALFRSRPLNRLAMRLVALPIGIDTDYWAIRHVQFHHTYANIEGYDLDIEPNAFLRQTPFHPPHPRYRFQHLYWPLIAALSLPYLNWYSDWLDACGRTPVRSRSGGRAWGAFLTFKLLHVALVLALPIWMAQMHGIAWPLVLATYFGGQMLASLFLVALILGTHWAEVQFYRPDPSGVMPHTWAEHAFHTCCDWTPRPAVLGYWMGGLNHHLTHHLFPTYSHRHYPALAAIVAQLSGAHSAPNRMAYRNLGYTELLRAQQRFLKSMGAGRRA